MSRPRKPPSTDVEAERQREAWTLARALQESLGADSLDEASLRLAQHLFHTALLLDESLRGQEEAALDAHGLRMRLLDVLLAWDDVGLPNTSLWNLFDGLGAARAAAPLSPPAHEPNPFRAFRKALARLRRHVGRPTLPAAMLYTWAELARCVESCLQGLARGLGRPDTAARQLPGTSVRRPRRSR